MSSCVLSHSVLSNSAAPWTVTCQASLSLEFYWSRLPFPTPRCHPDPRIEPMSLASPALAGRFFTVSTTWEAEWVCVCVSCSVVSNFSIESVLHIRWPQYWSFSFSISPSNEYSGLISFRMDWVDRKSTRLNSSHII